LLGGSPRFLFRSNAVCFDEFFHIGWKESYATVNPNSPNSLGLD